MKPFVAFDFDGTIVQSEMLVIQLINELSPKYGGRKIDEQEISGLSDLSIPDRMRALRMPLYNLPAMVLEGKLDRKASAGLRTVEGMREALALLKEKGYRLGILSSNTSEIIHGYPAANGLDAFGVVHSASNLFGKDKAIRKMARSLGIGLDRMIYVGDELRDVQACKKIGVPVIAVTWGCDSVKLLSEAGPDFLCHSPAELVEIVSRRG